MEGKAIIEYLAINFTFKQLPVYAEFLCKQRFEQFVDVLIEETNSVVLPLLKWLEDLSDAEFRELVSVSAKKFLVNLFQNNAGAEILESRKQWLENQLPNLERDQLVVRDLTLISYIRRRALTRFIPDYTDDLQIIFEILSDIDQYFLAVNTLAFETYIHLLEHRLKQELLRNDTIEEALVRSQEQLLQAQEIAGLGSYVWNLFQDKVELTPQVISILDLENSEDIFNYMEKVHIEDRRRLQNLIQMALEHNSTFECEYRLISQQGEKTIWARGQITEIAGEPVIKGTVIDITRQKQVEQELRYKSEALEAANTELQKFASVASHDLQEPLRKITTFGALLSKDCGPLLGERGQKYLGKITASAFRMQTLIEEILDFSQLRNHQIVFKKVDLNEVLHRVRSDMEVVIQSANAHITVGPLPIIEGNASQLGQLFQNLLSNALKFHRPGEQPVMEIRGQILPKENPPSCRITFRDEGIGFDENYLEEIFQLFQRLHGRTDFEGTGIGLAICKRVVENHRGSITALSSPGKGATFIVTLPLKLQDP